MNRTQEQIELARDAVRVRDHVTKAAAVQAVANADDKTFAGLVSAGEEIQEDLARRGAWLGGGGQVCSSSTDPATVDETEE